MDKILHGSLDVKGSKKIFLKIGNLFSPTPSNPLKTENTAESSAQKKGVTRL